MGDTAGSPKDSRRRDTASRAEQAAYGVLWALFKIAVLVGVIAVAVIVGVRMLAKP